MSRSGRIARRQLACFLFLLISRLLGSPEHAWRKTSVSFTPPGLNDTGFGKYPKDIHKYFTASILPHEIRPKPPEQRWGLLGLGLCVSSNVDFATRRLSDSTLLSCMQHCTSLSRGGCKSLSFSQRRKECILSGGTCSLKELRWKHTSYATFLPASTTDEVLPVYETIINNGSEAPIYVFACASAGFASMLKGFVNSVELSGEHAVIRVRRMEEEYLDVSHQDYDILEDEKMRKRDYFQINQILDAAWTGLRFGVKHTLATDIDVQVFPGWSELIRECTSATNFCFCSQPGYFPERAHPFNGGVIGVRADFSSVYAALELAAEYEPQFLVEASLLSDQRYYHLIQDIMSQFFFSKGAGLWALFNPALVPIFLEWTPAHSPILQAKIHHACGSATNYRSKLRALYRTRRTYYSYFPLCMTESMHGPQHPCCVIMNFQRSIFDSAEGVRPPFVVGSLYHRHDLRLGWESVFGHDLYYQWEQSCIEVSLYNMAVIGKLHSMDDFLETE